MKVVMINRQYQIIENEGNRFLFQYSSQGSALVRCYGRNSQVVIPSQCDYAEVTELAARIFAPQASWKGAYTAQNPFETEDNPMCAEKLESVKIPWEVCSIGDYAFYDCRRLTALSLTENIKRIGTHAFLNCEAISEITMNMHTSSTTCLHTIFSEIQNQITLNLNFADTNEKAKLVFPAYFEDATENAPARIFEYHTYGTGLRYRQCVPKGQLDFRAYDQCFPFARTEEEEKTLYSLVFARLEYPYALSEQHKKMYIQYLSENTIQIFDLIMAEENISRAERMLEWGTVTEQNLSALLNRASSKKHPSFIALLHEYGRRFSRRRKSLEL